MVRLGDQPFFKSSYTPQTNACVEVGSDAPSRVLVTDSKFNHSAPARAVKPVLSVSPSAFAAFVDSVR